LYLQNYNFRKPAFGMSFNLFESVKVVLSGDVTTRMAGILGESASSIQLAIQGIIPAVLTGVLLKADSGDVQDTLNLATDAARIDIPLNLNSLSGGTGSSKGMDFLKSLFGEKTSILSESISSYAGINSQSAISLMTIAAPAALGVLGKHILDSNMNASGLKSFLKSQKHKILNGLPTGIFLEGIMGVENLSEIAVKFSVAENSMPRPRPVSKWIFSIILAIIAIVAIWYFMYRPDGSTVPPVVVSDSSVTVKDTIVSPPDPEKQFSVKLPDGTVLNAKKGSIEDQLLIFFNDPNSHPSRRFPFNFDLIFNNGTAVISNESMLQVQHVALILKAYPKARIKIGGFNDRGGDSLTSKALSESRAAAVAAALKVAGANPAQIAGVEGFGSDFAKYSADAPDSLREKDRRISISIRAK
jgi:outer membrane protein OmpA-like peptidoglycan-associated protein